MTADPIHNAKTSRSREPYRSGSAHTLRNGLAFIITTCLIATIGYRLAGWTWIDSIYMVTITIFGVGYGEVNGIDETWLKVFTIVVIFAGCSSLLYVLGGIVQMLTEGEINRMLGKRMQNREIEQLSDHTIICGYGRVGQILAAELQSRGESLVILDKNAERVDLATEDGFLAMLGDAVGDDILQKVGLLRARTFATVLPNDAANVFITLAARELNESIRIIARAESPCTERKLIRSGATHVVLPATIGAMHIAQLATADDPDASLPDERYRLLSAQSRTMELKWQDGDACAIDQPSQAVLKDIETLATITTEATSTEAISTDTTGGTPQRHREHQGEFGREDELNPNPIG